MSRDPVGAASYLQSPNELNPWQYAAGNPTRFTDPDGREVDCQTLARGNSQFDYSACMRGRMANARPRVEPAKPAFEVTGPAAVPVAAGVKLATELEKVGAAAAANPGAAALGTMKMTPMYQLSPWGVHDMVSGTKESFERTGKNLGGLGACWEGDWWTCGETAPFGVVEGLMLVEGGRSGGAQMVEMGLVKGPLAKALTGGVKLGGGALASRFRSFRENPRLAPDKILTRTPEEAMKMAKEFGINLDGVRLDFQRNWRVTRPERAMYTTHTEKSSLADRLTLEDFEQNGEFLVQLDETLLRSDEALIAHLAHEAYEIQSLREIFKKQYSMSVAEFRQLTGVTDPITKRPVLSNLHTEAWDIADLAVWIMRGGGD